MVVVLAAFAGPIVFLVLYWNGVSGPALDDPFWETLMATWLATLIGLGAGLPLGLYVSRTIENESAERAAADARAAQEATVHTMLTSLLTELESVSEAIPDLASEELEVLRISAPLTHALTSAGATLIADNPTTLLELAQVDEAVRTVNRANSQWQETLAQAAIAPRSLAPALLQLHESLLVAAAKDLQTSCVALIANLRREVGAAT